MAPDELSISVEGLSKRFGDIAAVRDLTMRVRHGEIFGFLGPNGSGKTTSIRMMCGLLTPDSGRGRCLGFDIRTEANEIKQRVGYMTQKFSLYEDLSIRENLDFVGRMYAVPNRRTAVERTIERLGLSERRDQLVGTLSGGWKQRLALAACLLHGPRLLLLDEPTAGVDPKARRDFWEEIHRLAAEGVSVLVSTHYMDEAERCHRLAYIFGGRLLAEGSARDVVRDSGLTTWSVEGEGVQELAGRIRGLPGVEQIVAFGAALHVSGTDAARLLESLKPFFDDPAFRWAPARAGLEDVFIRLMGRGSA